jgi:glucose-1-phosphate adenylyltransferase
LKLDADNPRSSHDFSKDIIPSVIRDSRVFACKFIDQESGMQPYWQDVGTLSAYWSANMELLDATPKLDLYEKKWPILTYEGQLPSAKFVCHDTHRQLTVLDSIVSDGCIVSSPSIERCVLSCSVNIHSTARLEESIVLPEVDIGAHSRIRRAIIDRDCQIPEGTIIGENPDADAQRFRVTPDGIVLVTREMLGQKPKQHI